MANKTQIRIADWTMSFALASTVLPFVGLLALGGTSLSYFWLKCVGLVGFAIFSLWMLNQNSKVECKCRTFAWVVALTYFVTVLAAVAQFSESLLLMLILGAPEAIGAALCLVGLFHWIRSRETPEELKP